MVQRPLKRVKIEKKPTKYRRMLGKARTEDELITKEINKGIVEKYMNLYGRRRNRR